MLATGLIVAYGYMMEVFFGWYSGNPYEGFMMLNRMIGPVRATYWVMLIFCNVHRAAVPLVPARAHERRSGCS